jgi:hypothetical protein
MRKDAGDVAQAARCLSIDAPAQPFNGQQSSHPEAFLTPGIITPFPLRKAMKPICLFLFRGDAARHRRATVKSGRRTRTGPPQSSSK